MPKEKSISDRIMDSFNILGKVIETIIHHADGEIKRIKKKVLYFSFLLLKDKPCMDSCKYV